MGNGLYDLHGKRVLITGGAGYLGRGMSEAICELGGELIIGSRHIEEHQDFKMGLIEKYSTSVELIKLDLDDVNSIDHCVESILHGGKVDVLINNAYYGAGKELHNMDDNTWMKGIDGSINSVFRLTSRILPSMLKQGYGRIINIASMYGVVAPDVSIYEDNDFYNPINYGVGKAGIIQFTKYVAAVYGRYGVTCNAVSPGPFPNDSVRNHKAFLDSLNSKVPLGRVGRPDEIKGVIGLLASDASSYINGANIPVDGGWTIW